MSTIGKDATSSVENEAQEAVVVITTVVGLTDQTGQEAGTIGRTEDDLGRTIGIIDLHQEIEGTPQLEKDLRLSVCVANLGVMKDDIDLEVTMATACMDILTSISACILLSVLTAINHQLIKGNRLHPEICRLNRA